MLRDETPLAFFDNYLTVYSFVRLGVGEALLGERSYLTWSCIVIEMQ